MDKLTIIDETAPFTLEDYKKAVAQIKGRDWLYQEPLEPEKPITDHTVNSAIYAWCTQQEMHDQP